MAEAKNTDGSLGNLGLAGGGGVIRYESGNWVVGYSRRIGVTLGFEVELMGIKGWSNHLCEQKLPSH